MSKGAFSKAVDCLFADGEGSFQVFMRGIKNEWVDDVSKTLDHRVVRSDSAFWFNNFFTFGPMINEKRFPAKRANSGVKYSDQI